MSTPFSLGTPSMLAALGVPSSAGSGSAGAGAGGSSSQSLSVAGGGGGGSATAAGTPLPLSASLSGASSAPRAAAAASPLQAHFAPRAPRSPTLAQLPLAQRERPELHALLQALRHTLLAPVLAGASVAAAREPTVRPGYLPDCLGSDLFACYTPAELDQIASRNVSSDILAVLRAVAASLSIDEFYDSASPLNLTLAGKVFVLDFDVSVPSWWTPASTEKVGNGEYMRVRLSFGSSSDGSAKDSLNESYWRVAESLYGCIRGLEQALQLKSEEQLIVEHERLRQDLAALASLDALHAEFPEADAFGTMHKVGSVLEGNALKEIGQLDLASFTSDQLRQLFISPGRCGVPDIHNPRVCHVLHLYSSSMINAPDSLYSDLGAAKFRALHPRRALVVPPPLCTWGVQLAHRAREAEDTAPLNAAAASVADRASEETHTLKWNFEAARFELPSSLMLEATLQPPVLLSSTDASLLARALGRHDLISASSTTSRDEAATGLIDAAYLSALHALPLPTIAASPHLAFRVARGSTRVSQSSNDGSKAPAEPVLVSRFSLASSDTLYATLEVLRPAAWAMRVAQAALALSAPAVSPATSKRQTQVTLRPERRALGLSFFVQRASGTWTCEARLELKEEGETQVQVTARLSSLGGTQETHELGATDEHAASVKAAMQRFDVLSAVQALLGWTESLLGPPEQEEDEQQEEVGEAEVEASAEEMKTEPIVPEPSAQEETNEAPPASEARAEAPAQAQVKLEPASLPAPPPPPAGGMTSALSSGSLATIAEDEASPAALTSGEAGAAPATSPVTRRRRVSPLQTDGSPPPAGGTASGSNSGSAGQTSPSGRLTRRASAALATAVETSPVEEGDAPPQTRTLRRRSSQNTRGSKSPAPPQVTQREGLKRRGSGSPLEEEEQGRKRRRG